MYILGSLLFVMYYNIQSQEKLSKITFLTTPNCVRLPSSELFLAYFLLFVPRQPYFYSGYLSSRNFVSKFGKCGSMVFLSTALCGQGDVDSSLCT